MDTSTLWILLTPCLFLLSLPSTALEQEAVRQSLVEFLQKLSNGNDTMLEGLRWNASTDPCSWSGVACNNRSNLVMIIDLKNLPLGGIVDGGLLCQARSLSKLYLVGSGLKGPIPPEISDCGNLTHLYLSGNRFSGELPPSIADLSNLKRLDISGNSFSGTLPGLPRISGLVTLQVQNNRFTGEIPQFDFTNLVSFNFSYNSFSGPVPDLAGRYDDTRFLGNPGLCGTPLFATCPPISPLSSNHKSKLPSRRTLVMLSGYIILTIAIILLITFKLIHMKKNSKKMKKNADATTAIEENVSSETSRNNNTSKSTEYRTGRSRSEYSLPSTESAMMSTSLVVLQDPTKVLSFKDLLKAPAELMGKGRFGSSYKVVMGDGVTLAVKRMKDDATPEEEFQRRMRRIDGARHRNVLPPVAFYCSGKEKLVVYEYQPNGSLFNLLHGNIEGGKKLDWGSRLAVAANVSASVAFMHRELSSDDPIPHGSLKSSNILFDAHMNPCISEYGLRIPPPPSRIAASVFEVDVQALGVILLELLTGKVVQNNDGLELAKWVNSVVRNEWTVEVFDKSLVTGDANEERMVRLLQVALMCVGTSERDRPGVEDVAGEIAAVREEEERSSMVSEG